MVGTIRHRCHGYECERCRRGVITQPECEGDMGLLAYNLWYQAESRQGRQDERDSPSLLVTQLEITSGVQKKGDRMEIYGWKTAQDYLRIPLSDFSYLVFDVSYLIRE
ncbi:hypothetical protein TNCV_4690961 [Trichonephila clavipes]|nr:hypothetical protein TNCV_4690961 [Trichonephila clavipes]